MGKWENVKQKPFRHIQAYSGISRHNQTYSGNSGNIQAYSELCVTLAYSEPWYIQNPTIFKRRGKFRTLVYPKFLTHSEPETYSESWAIQNPGIFRTAGILRNLSNIYDEAL